MSESLRDEGRRGARDDRGRLSPRHRAARPGGRGAGRDPHRRFDAILCLASPGPAPEGLGWTGDPVFNAFWTYAGTPCVTLPLLEVDGMPMGVQLTGPRGGDGPLLRTARWLEQAVA